jgi:Arc/MetJ-type ribon-helix-helix transcriptional regulator
MAATKQRSKVSATRRAAHSASVSRTTSGAAGGEAKVSRPAGSSYTAEKNDVTIKSCITDSMDQDLRLYARQHGYASTSDLIREALKLVLYGEQHVLNMHRARIESLARNLSRAGQKGGAE